MCGIVAKMNKHRSITEELFKALFYIQHRGQQSSGFVVFSSMTKKVLKAKEFGLVENHLKDLEYFHGTMGVGHVRYPTNGDNTRNEIQPFSVAKPFGISLVHNGNITNAPYLRDFLYEKNVYPKGTSDSELLLHLFYYYIEKDMEKLSHDVIVDAIQQLYHLYSGSFCVVIMIIILVLSLPILVTRMM